MPLDTTPNVIVLKGDLYNYDEGLVADSVTLKPGMHAQTTAVGTYTPATGAGTAVERLVVEEDPIVGGTIEAVFAAGARLRLHKTQPGDELQLVLVAGQNAAKTSYLTNNGDGKVKVASGSDARLYRSLDDLDLTGGGAVDTFIRARAL